MASMLARLALALTGWTERWVPDAFIFALLATLIVVGAALAATPTTLTQVIDVWGKGFWELIPFTLQMAMIIITGHVLATSPPMGRLIRAVASWPRSPRAAIVVVTLFSLGSSLLNWGFSVVFTAVLAKEVARRVKGIDYRALAAASFLGMGTIWAQGLSGSAVLQMATPGALQPQIREVVSHGGLIPGGIIGFRQTIFTWQSFVCIAVEIVFVTIVMCLAAPPANRARAAKDLGIELGEREFEPPTAKAVTPGAWLEHSPILTWIIVALGATYLIRYFMTAGEPLNAITLNAVNLAFLLIGFLLHRTPAGLASAVKAATPAVWGVVLQFPFYASIAAIITATGLSTLLANAFVRVSTPMTFPPLVAIYSAVLGVFVPSGGTKWVIMAPYVMSAAHSLKVNLGWMVTTYNLGEGLANLVQPFWMLPVLGMFKLSARDVMGYTLIVCLALAPVVLILVTIFGPTLRYPL
jgi:short-chain fatty acids transporter